MAKNKSPVTAGIDHAIKNNKPGKSAPGKEKVESADNSPGFDAQPGKIPQIGGIKHRDNQRGFANPKAGLWASAPGTKQKLFSAKGKLMKKNDEPVSLKEEVVADGSIKKASLFGRLEG